MIMNRLLVHKIFARITAPSVVVPPPVGTGFLLKEDGYKVLQEDEFSIKLENNG